MANVINDNILMKMSGNKLNVNFKLNWACSSDFLYMNTNNPLKNAQVLRHTYQLSSLHFANYLSLI